MNLRKVQFVELLLNFILDRIELIDSWVDFALLFLDRVKLFYILNGDLIHLARDLCQ